MMMLINTKGNPHGALLNDITYKYELVKKRLAKGEAIKKKIAVYKQLPEPLTLQQCATVCREIKKVNAGIADYIEQYDSDFFQNYDAQIAIEVMRLLRDQDVPSLCIHDSFIVPKSKAPQLRQAMFDAWEIVLGSNDSCVIDAKYGDALEEEFQIPLEEDLVITPNAVMLNGEILF
jgi:hypothetical protein